MNRKQLLKLIEEGENLKVEFKQRFSEHEKIAKEIIAFANTSGGVIIFGINDNGKIYGVQSEKEVTELLKETITNYCEPIPIYKVSYIEVDHSDLELNLAQVYIRVNYKSVPASKEMIKLLQTKSADAKLKKYSIGKNEKMVFEYLKINDFINSKELSSLANISARRASRTLLNMVRANILAIHTKDNGEDYYSSIL